MKTLVACLLLCLSARSWAADVAVSGAGRATPVPVLAPSLPQTMTLQKGVGAPDLGAIGEKIMGLPGAAELRDLGGQMMNLRKPDAIPALPQSAVVTGEASRGLEVPGRLSALTPKTAQSLGLDLTHQTPAAKTVYAPATNNFERELNEKTERLQEPIAAVSKTGAGAPSASELKRLGEEIWDVMGLSGRGGDSRGQNDRRDPVLGSVGAASSFGSAGTLAPSSSREEGGSRGFVPAPGFASGVNDSLEAETVGAHSSSLSSRETSNDSIAVPSNPFDTKAVALITMDVVGQSLLLSDSGLAAQAERGALAVVNASRGSELAENSNDVSLRDAVAGEQGLRLKSLSAAGLAEQALAESAAEASFAAGASSDRVSKARFSAAKNSRRTPPAPFEAGSLPWAGFVLLLAAGAVVLPEFRR
jgi:hypothetical protein